ncbi:MAG: hypothetical protein B7Y65_01625 [Azorhizobium sp. 35-67-15]|nr:MAG: hypothetical protein B7Y65_01625 [Azorhizobium sp. 35-67-15]
MKRADFERSPSGTLVPTERGQWAFVPKPLPPTNVDFGVLSSELADAAAALGELNGVSRTLRNPYLLIRPLQAREALTSSSMEGTYTTLDDLLLVEAGAGENNRAPDTREVLNYRVALSEAIGSMSSVPLSLRTLKNAHARLLAGVSRQRGATVRPGELKLHQNFIGSYAIETARFIPPPRAETETCLSDLELFIHREDRGGLHVLIDAALIHYQFETVHPFADGNGRVGRMLVPLHLFTMGAIREPMLYISPVLEPRKDEYIDRMFAVSQNGDWIGWVRFFLEVLKLSAEASIATSDQLRTLETGYRQRLQAAGRSANVLNVVDLLFETPVLSIPQIAAHLGVTYRAARMNVDTLVEVGILEELPNTSSPKFYAARGILNIISGLQAQLST